MSILSRRTGGGSKTLWTAGAWCALAACRPQNVPHDKSPPAPSVATNLTVAPVAPRFYPKPSMDEIRAKLSPLSYEVTQKDATEPPFHNAYWDNHEVGIYVDVVTGEPLFSSADKFDSGTGWPSFVRPIDPSVVTTRTDTKLGMTRTEVRSKSGDSHLGHLFDDGPPPLRTRYCMNSASLRFVPLARLEAEGYAAYRPVLTGQAASSPATAKTNNACAEPPPGERAGCSATLATATLEADASVAEALTKLAGVLQVERGAAGTTLTARVIYDPKKLGFTQLLDAWLRAAPAGHRKVFVVGEEQRTDAHAWKSRASQGPSVTIEPGVESTGSSAP